MKVLIAGANGQLGRCLQDRVPKYDFEVLATYSNSLDITDSNAVASYFTIHKPDLVINAAAYTAVDKAESEQEWAAQVNTQGPENLAKFCHQLDIPTIHISTDYVFDGLADEPYQPDSPTSPAGVYGKTKRDGELAVIRSNPKHVIIRTSWVFSEYGNNFVKTMIRLATESSDLSVVADQYGCPTYAGDLADAILKVVCAINSCGDWSKFGIYHFCGEEATSWHGFARAIISAASKKGIITRKPELHPIATSGYPTPAPRPDYSVLDCRGFPAVGMQRDWHKSLRNVLNILASNSSS